MKYDVIYFLGVDIRSPKVKTVEVDHLHCFLTSTSPVAYVYDQIDNEESDNVTIIRMEGYDLAI